MFMGISMQFQSFSNFNSTKNRRFFSLLSADRLCHLVLHVALRFPLLDLAAEHDRDHHAEGRLQRQGVGAHEEAVLGPLLRRAVHGVHLPRPHASADEEDGQHRGEVDRQRRRVQRFLESVDVAAQVADELDDRLADLFVFMVI